MPRVVVKTISESLTLEPYECTSRRLSPVGQWLEFSVVREKESKERRREQKMLVMGNKTEEGRAISKTHTHARVRTYTYRVALFSHARALVCSKPPQNPPLHVKDKNKSFEETIGRSRTQHALLFASSPFAMFYVRMFQSVTYPYSVHGA